MTLTFEFKDALTFIYHYLCFVQLVTTNLNKFNKFTNKMLQVLKSDEQSGHISLCLSLTFSELVSAVSCSKISNSVKVGWFKAWTSSLEAVRKSVILSLTWVDIMNRACWRRWNIDVCTISSTEFFSSRQLFWEGVVLWKISLFI